MAEILKSLSVDVAKKNTFQAIVAKQGDTASRFLKIQMMNEGVPIIVDGSSSVTINARRSDTQSKTFLGTVNADGTVTVPLTQWMLAIDGLMSCSVTVVDGEGRKLTTTSFTVNVEFAEYNGEEIAEDENYDVLTGLILQVETLNTNMSAAEVGRVTAENSRVTAETQRQQTFNTLKSAMETATDAANEVVENAASIEAIAATMQITFFYDDEGYPCYQDKSTN